MPPSHDAWNSLGVLPSLRSHQPKVYWAPATVGTFWDRNPSEPTAGKPAPKLPACAWLSTTAPELLPDRVQPAKLPVSKPPLATTLVCAKAAGAVPW